MYRRVFLSPVDYFDPTVLDREFSGRVRDAVWVTLLRSISR
jgi:hypothetical protein